MKASDMVFMGVTGILISDELQIADGKTMSRRRA
jgi:hypothetical protein